MTEEDPTPQHTPDEAIEKFREHLREMSEEMKSPLPRFNFGGRATDMEGED